MNRSPTLRTHYMTITDYHRAIFDYLETYRREHPEAGLTYSLRQKNKAGRPRNLYLFTGDDKYISIGLYGPISNNNKTRTISFYATYDPVSDRIKTCTLAIVFSDQKLAGQEGIYQQIIQQIGSDQFKEYSHKRFALYYTGADWQNSLGAYLEQHRPIIDRVLQEAGVAETFKIPEKKLEADIQVIDQMDAAEAARQSVLSASLFHENRAEPNYWVFQCNPSQFRIIDSLRDNALQTWRIAAHANKIKPGDKVILWVTGNQSGCYALAQVASEVYVGTDETGEHYYQLTGMGKEATQRVKITLLQNLWDQPVMKTQLQDIPAFADFNGGNQGTNFTATSEQYELIQHMVQRTTHRFWKYSPGRDGDRWPDDIQDGIMAIDYSNHNTGSLNQYNTRTDLDKHLGMANGNSNDTSSMMLFKDASIGDVVVANQGLTKVIGIGIISGPYQYRGDGSYNQHYRTVNWLADQPWQYPKDQFAGHKFLFGRTTFTRTTIGSRILQEYVKQYAQYRSIFEQHGLLNPTSSLSNTKPMPIVKTNHSKNIILYGPPGTGKTFGTIDLAVDIIDGQSNSDHKVNKVRFDQLRKEGQVEFVTFHQSYTYEDFVVGIKPDVNAGSLKFDYNYGILYRIAEKARTNFLQNQPASPLAQKHPFEEVFSQFIEPLIEEGKEIPVKMAKSKWFNLTDVSERTIEFRKSNGNTDDVLSIAILKRMYEGSQRLKHEGLNVYYNPLAEVLQSLGEAETSALTEVKLENYVLIIDEINRANMSRVFGELITLLEEDKRLGAANELTVTLSSGESFALPPNLYLIGTMNTADKSLALLDIALRRRFEFQYTKPDPKLLTSPAKEILTKLNQAIRAEHKPADFLIGHAYFMDKDESQLPEVFNNRVIPLLMEYFNGKVLTVIKVLEKAGVMAEADPITDELTVSHVE